MSGGDATRFGKYKILKRIAAGGMGEVHLAKLKGPVGFEKLVVIKRLLDHRQNEPKYIDMFFSEARVAAQLTHSNIAQVYEVGNYEGIHYIAMEYVQGKSLRKILDVLESQHQLMPHAYVTQIISELCAGLAFAHDARHLSGAHMELIHRDINPHNVLVSYHGEVKIIDFGIAKSELNLEQTKAGTIKGTVVYMSPEQSHGKKLDRRSDIFSVGICLYEALTGVNPFHKDTLGASMEVIREANYPPLDPQNPRLALFAPIVTRALARQVDQRYQDARQMGDDLRALLNENAIARPTVPLSKYLASMFADDIAEEERLLSQTELAEIAPMGETDTIVVELSQSNYMADEKTVADQGGGSDNTGAYKRRTDNDNPAQDDAEPKPALTVMTPVPEAPPSPTSDAQAQIEILKRLWGQPRFKMVFGGVLGCLLLGTVVLMRSETSAPPTVKPAMDPNAQASSVPEVAAPASEAKPAANEQAKSEPNKQANNSAPQVVPVVEPAAPEPQAPAPPPAPAPPEVAARRAPMRRSPPPLSHRHQARGRPQHMAEPPPEAAQPQSTLPMLQLFLDPSDLRVTLNGAAAGTSIKLRSGAGTLKIGTGSDPDTDPFIIVIHYKVENKSISYSVESEPWANVAGVGGISLGRTPLQNVRGESTTVLEFRNPHVGGTPRVTMRFTSP